MILKTSTLRPGLLVGLKTNVRGNVSYRKLDIETDHAVDILGKVRMAKWETERTIADAEEFERASQVRAAAAYMVSRICAKTSFGYLCPEEKSGELEQAIKDARATIDGFNSGATVTRIDFYVMAGRVARDDVEAARAVRAEMRDLIEEMEKGVSELSAEKIRDAAKRARELGAMLSDDGKARVDAAVDIARTKARAISKAVKAGEVAALEVDAATLAKLAAARTSFLDLDTAEREIEPLPETARAIDLNDYAEV